MKRKLKQIYQDFSIGKLTQKGALDKIKDLKLQVERKKTEVLLSYPSWNISELSKTVNTDVISLEQHHIVIFELPEISIQNVKKAIANIKTVSVKLNQQKNIAEQFNEVTQYCFELVKKTLSQKPLGNILFQLVIPDNQEEVLRTGLSGLFKSTTTENPNIIGQIIIVSPNIGTADLVKLLKTDQNLLQDKVIKYEKDSRKVLRLREVQVGSETPKIVFKEKGVYLISGGLGGLGVLMAKEIADQSPDANIILAGRSSLGAANKKVMDTLVANGLKVDYQKADIVNIDQVKLLVEYIQLTYKQLNGIVHCAGINSDNFLIKKPTAEFQRVLLPKVNGTYNLDEASKEIDLDFMVFFSSIASWLGNAGQTDYAAANGFMDGFAIYRNQLVEAGKRRGKTISICWPLWQDGGMKMDDTTEEILSANTGLKSLETWRGMHSFYRSLKLPYGQIVVADGDHEMIREQLFEKNPIRPIKTGIGKTSNSKIDTDTLFEKTQDFIKEQLAIPLKIEFHKLDARTPMENYGIDSILSMGLTNQLEKTFGNLRKTLFFEYLTIRDLTEYFVQSFPDTLNFLFNEKKSERGQEQNDTSSQKPSESLPPKPFAAYRFLDNKRLMTSAKTNKNGYSNDAIAIIGLSGRYPEAKDITEYWYNLRDGKDCIIEVPKDRWDWRQYYTDDRTKSGRHYSKWGGFISGVDEFDPRFFNISPREAKIIDPQERLFLQHTWSAVEDAGYTREGLQISEKQDLAGQVGVYVGVMYGEYQLYGVQGKPKGLVNSYASIANRVSYVFNLHGPSMTLDTMCSSSLTAIHLACQDLKLGRTSMAIAGGVNISIHPNKYLFLSAHQFISGNGHCQSFGEGGDGYIPGEGVGVVVLKRVSEAVMDGDHIYGVIKGSALNHGGKTNGYSVPNPKAQSTAINRAIIESGIDPRHISYIEAHGTGTKLGDPIEITALDQTFKKHTKDNGYCQIGSAKSNIGHCESAAGIAGLTKVLLQMQHKQIVPSLHSAKLNPYIDFKNTPFIVSQTLKNWEQPVIGGREVPRIAGISSFGAGGSNAHIILEEYQEPVNQLPVSIDSDKRFIVPLSARTADQLKQKTEDLMEFIGYAEPELDEMAYTLQVGREAMDERLGLVVNSMHQLTNKLKAYINGETEIKNVYRDKVNRNNDFLSPSDTKEDSKQIQEKWMSQGNHQKISELWSKGHEVDWNKLYEGHTPKRISLPTYPFAREKYWVEIENEPQIVSISTSNGVLHPLLHTNTSDFAQYSYSSIFQGDEHFFMEMKVGSKPDGHKKTLSASAYIEMTRAAIEKAMPVEGKSGMLDLKNIVYGQPFIHKEGKRINIALYSKEEDNVDFEIYSNENGEEIIHCQGSANFNQKVAVEILNIEQLKPKMDKFSVTGHNFYSNLAQSGISFSSNHQGITVIDYGENQLLVQLSISSTNKDQFNDYFVYPVILDSALVASGSLIEYDQSSEPTAIDSLRIIKACANEMFAFTRLTHDSETENVKLDIDLCDLHGNLCLQLQGLTYQELAYDKNADVSSSSLIQEPIRSIHHSSEEERKVPEKISILDALPLDNIKIELEGTSAIGRVSLLDPMEENISSDEVIRTSVQLEDTAVHFSLKTGRPTNSLAISLFNLGKGVFSIETSGDESNNMMSKNLIIQIISAFNKIEQQGLIKAVILKGNELNFLHGGQQSFNDAIELNFFETITSFPYPIIAEMSGNAGGVGLLVGSLCDFMVCSEEGKYYYTDPQKNLYPSAAVYELFKERFGAIRAADLLYDSTKLTGKQLRKKGYTFSILPKNKVKAYTRKLAFDLSIKSQEALSLLKKHSGRHIGQKTKNLDTLIFAPNKREKINTDSKIVSVAKHIVLETHNEQVLEIKIGEVKEEYGIKALVTDLTKIFTQVNNSFQYKTILLTTDHPNFLLGTEEDVNAKDILDFQHMIFESKYPVIAVLHSSASDAAWIMALFCDACVYNDEAVYSITNSWQNPELAKQAVMILSHRFGNHFGKEVVFSNREFTGFELEKKVGVSSARGKQVVVTRALHMAENWAKMPVETIISWKKQMVRTIQDNIKVLPAWSEPKEENSKLNSNKPVPISLKSEVISAMVHPEGILVVTMEDRETKNMFSESFENGMEEVFNHIENSSRYKVVILIGYENYFASGGTKKSLLAIQEGKVKFTDTKVFQLGLLCKLPVIAAMQGHGIGAGWCMGMFADFVLFSKESKYMSPYMNFGFTPGAGATYVFPEKMGYDLSRETMFTAREMSGSELMDRGMPMPVIAREKIYDKALNLAHDIAKSSQSIVIAFKDQFTYHQKMEMEKVLKLELEMHEKTFVGKSDILKQINENFNQGVLDVNREKEHGKKSLSESHDPDNNIANRSKSGDMDMLSEITNNLRRTLARELHLEEHEIEAHIQFIDLGLDSITGVTWIRKINEQYKTNIEATKIYSYSTLDKLSLFVMTEAIKLGRFDHLREEKTISTETVLELNGENIAIDDAPQQTEMLSEISTTLRKLLAQELHLQEHEVEDNIQFVDLGLDSITGVTWIRKINEIYKTRIEATKIYSYPTLAELSQFINNEAEKIGSIVVKPKVNAPSLKFKNNVITALSRNKLISKRNDVVSQKTNKINKEYNSEPIAIIGMSGQFPKAKNIDDFWINISQGKNCISEIPEERWDTNTFYTDGKPSPGKTNSKWAGMIEEYDLFDPLFFNISPAEAESMDPQQRVLLQACWNSFENAGYNPLSLSGSKCGVYIGCASGDYHLLSRELQISAEGFTGGATSVLAARISYLLDLQGPCLSIDTACSSSLVAIATACENLNTRSCDLALAGGVYIMVGPDMHIKSAQSGMLSTNGRCYTFDNRANGFVPGEGVGVVVLKRLADAVKDDDIIHGVIDGWGINQDGKTNGLTAPNKESQSRLQQEVYDKFKIDPGTIQLVEAHGTGTKLGDPIEVEALNETFKKYSNKKAFCALGSVKSNIGHCLTAAGVAGFIKTLLAIKHKQLPPTINYNSLNEHISLKNSPFFINNELQEWNVIDSAHRRAAISAFGFSGTNAHLVISEYKTPHEVKKPVSVITQDSKLIVPLSAKTANQLKQRASDLIDFIHISEKSLDLLELAYTLQIGRKAMDERLCLLVSTKEQLVEKLQSFINDEQHVRGLYYGQVKRNREGLSIVNRDKDLKAIIIDTWIKQKKLSSLVDLWIKGLEIDWNLLYEEKKPRRISLPGYPFLKERYWFEDHEAVNGLKPATKLSVLHPLLHSNVSDLYRQCYNSVFNGNEFLTRDYQLNDHKLLPALSQLEMVFEAVIRATSKEKSTTVVNMYNISWARPLVVHNNKSVTISVLENDTDEMEYEILSSEEEENDEVYCKGEVFLASENNFEKMNISQLTSSFMESEFEKDSFFNTLTKLKLNVGFTLQSLTDIYKGSDYLFAKIIAPSSVATTLPDYCLHPSVMEGIMQACMAFVLDMNHLPDQPLTPVALDFISVISSCTSEMYAHVRPSQEKLEEGSSVKFDIDLCDRHGEICVIMQGLELAYDNRVELQQRVISSENTTNKDFSDSTTYVYRWEETQASLKQKIKDHKSVLVVCSNSTPNFHATIKEFYARKGNCEVTILFQSDKTHQVSQREWEYDIHSPKSLQKCLQKSGKIDAFYFLAMKEKVEDSFTFDELQNNQENNEIQLLRIVKNLKESNKIGESVDTYILTLDNHSITQMSGECYGAGATGFAYSLAQGKYQFRVRNFDLSSADIENKEAQEQLLETIYNEPASSRGELFKIVSGKKYRQVFMKLIWDAANTLAIRQGGVYLIAGGSGTVGKIISRQLIEKYNAQVIWLGTSAKDSEKMHKALKQHAVFESNVFYYRADVKDRLSMQQAVTRIKDNFQQIHGAVFAGMVFDFENSIDQTTEAKFRAILETKTQGSWVFYNALKNQSLDFMCYFSSGQAYSFSGAAKLSAYASAITFADRLVQSFNKNSTFPIGIINWGFWKSSVNVIKNENGSVFTDNLDALEDSQGFACFEHFINKLKKGRINQVLCMKVSEQMKPLINSIEDEYVSLAKEQFDCELLNVEIPNQKVDELIEAHKQNQLENWLAKLLFCEINRMIKKSGENVAEKVDDLLEQCGINEKYFKWFYESMDMLEKHGFVQLKDGIVENWKVIDIKKVWDEWKTQKNLYCEDIEFKSLVILLDDCLQKLSEIVQGDKLATDIIFPNSSMEKVEGIYKNNTTSDTFNEIVANSVVAYLELKLKSDPESRLRILEIGAGTGGTSAIVFQKLKPFQKSIEKYCYTDISKAFFFHAEKSYQPENPFIVCQHLDIEKPIENQNLEIGAFDLVIATNVLHATKNIRNTLRNAKAALCENGYIILNEMSDKSLTTHLTFGLLDGWWLFEDSELRIPNCPGLYPEGWQKVLEEEGFTSVNFPIKEAHILGQQIVLAQSNGVVRQKKNIDIVHKVEIAKQPERTEVQQLKKVSKSPLAVAHIKVNAKDHVKETVLYCLATTLKMTSDTIDTEIAFSDYGIDSILGGNFVNQLNTSLSISLNTAIIFEYSSTDRLSEHIFKTYNNEIEAQLYAKQESSINQKDTNEILTSIAIAAKNNERRQIHPRDVTFRKSRKTEKETRSIDIAVIGMSGQMPKANNLEEFWDNIINGVDGVSELPKHYLNQEQYYSTEKKSGKTRCKWGGIVEERDCFDPLFFNLSPWEAESMNPHQRLVLQEGWKAIEDAGYNPKYLSGSKTGVYIGVEPTGYYGNMFTGYSDAIISSRLSYVLNLKGPALSINTGCSSSGVALHLACESLRNKEINLAIAGGVNACMDHSVQIRLDEIDMLSPKGRCNTFDEGGSGTIISEGVGIVVLKRMEDAIADKDFIYGVICGSATNQDGASNGITAPNGTAQEELIVDVYKKFNINPEDITYVEAHGTGTKLGDPIEANALVRAFNKFTIKQRYCAIGSAKSHIGHTGAAAGVTGLIKVLQSMQHDKIPKLLHFNKINPLIEFDSSPFYIPTQATEWKANGKPRIAAVNSFGHSGTNVHLVVKEFIGGTNDFKLANNRTLNDSVIIPLSAKIEHQLKNKAADLLHFIENMESSAIDLISMAYTLQFGREAMDERLGFVVNSVEELTEKLRSYLNAEQKSKNFNQGRVKKGKEALNSFNNDVDNQETIEKWVTAKNYEGIVGLWVQGIEFDWTVFYSDYIPKRMRLPTYPFDKERYWYTETKSGNGTLTEKLPSQKIKITNNIDAIENIINEIDSDAIEEKEALALLKNLI